MQGINSREYRILREAFEKCESMLIKDGNSLAEREYNETRISMEELDALYERFHSLCGELEKCIKEYESKKKTVRSAVNKCNRILISELLKHSKKKQIM